MKIGILSLQGAVEPHAEKLRGLGAEVVEVRLSPHLKDLQGIVLPGGESTAMIKLLHKNKLWDDLQAFVQSHPAWGVCAGAILLADQVERPAQDSLKAIDISIERNAFGRQVDSFEAELTATRAWPKDRKLKGVFIRAPRIRRVGPEVQVLAEWNQEPVMVRDKNTLVSSFHPELTDSSDVHEYFLSICRTQKHVLNAY